jgi:hypothetical protein
MSQSADELRERFEVVRREQIARQKIREFIDAGDMGKAEAIASALGGPLPRGVVVPLWRTPGVVRE